MKVVNCGYEYKHSEHFRINRPDGSGDNILLIVRSKAFFYFNGITEYVEPNTVVLFRKGNPQVYGAFEGEYVNDWVHFEAEDDELEYISSLGIKFDEAIRLGEVSRLSKIILSMFSEMYSQNRNSEKTAQAYLHLLLFKLSDMCTEANKNDALSNTEIRKGIEKIRSEIFRFPEREWSVALASRSISVSQSYFQHLYKARFGVSFISDVTAARMERSKYLLLSTEYTVSAISEFCGYHNSEHFMRVFKSHFGLTPTEYRLSFASNNDKVIMSKKRPPFTIKL